MNGRFMPFSLYVRLFENPADNSYLVWYISINLGKKKASRCWPVENDFA
jgi:hypothetical protein